MGDFVRRTLGLSMGVHAYRLHVGPKVLLGIGGTLVENMSD
jgi:hypothetical protein